MENTPWKEYETGGRKYWVHDRTKETTWNAPKEIAGQSYDSPLSVEYSIIDSTPSLRLDIIARYR